MDPGTIVELPDGTSATCTGHNEETWHTIVWMAGKGLREVDPRTLTVICSPRTKLAGATKKAVLTTLNVVVLSRP